MANPQHVAGHASHKQSASSSSHSRGHSPAASTAASNAPPTPTPATSAAAPTAPSTQLSKLTAAYDGLGTDVRLPGAINGSWEVWGNGSRRTASIGSVASVQPMGTSSWGSSRTAWTAETSAEWPSLDQPDSHAKKDSDPSPAHPFSMRHRSAHSAHTVPSNGTRLVGLGDDDERATPRFDKESVTPTRFSAGSSPSKPAGSFATAFTSPTPTVTTSSSAGPAAAEHEISASLRSLALEEEYRTPPAHRPGGSGIPAAATASGLPAMSMHAAPHFRGPVPPVPGGGHRPSFNGFVPPSDFYYNGNAAQQDAFRDYSSFGTFDSYRSTPDHSLYGSPALQSPPPTSLYPTPQAMVHDLQRSPSAMYFDYSSQGRPPPSPFYYPNPQAMMYHRGPHSPMPAPAPIALAQPPAAANKPRGDMPFQIQNRPQLHQQNMMMQPPSPLPPQIFAGGVPQMPMGMAPQFHPALPPHARPGQHLNGPHGGNGGLGFGNNPNNQRQRREDGPPAMRSQLLDEFRTNKTRKWELREIFGYIVEFSGDQHGSRFIQQKLETAPPEEKQIVFDEIVPDSALQLIRDVFGNYVIQKLFEHGTPTQRNALATAMEGHILQLSLQMYGCRVVQKAIDFMTLEQQTSLIKELESHILKCVLDANGNHVVQKLIEVVNPPERLAFVSAFRGSVYDLSTHPFGCRVLQRCFAKANDEHTRPLLDELHKYTNNLMQDQFGNYVVQYVLDFGKPEDRMLIVSKLRGTVLLMAKHKFASNVCERALVTADEENQRLLIEEIMTPRADGVAPLVTMMKDQFANYVLQRALQVAKGEQRQQLYAMVRTHLANMRRYASNYTKHLVAIERIVNTQQA